MDFLLGVQLHYAINHLKKMIRLMLYSLSLEEERLQQQQFSLFDPDPISPDVFFMQKKKKRAKRKDWWA